MSLNFLQALARIRLFNNLYDWTTGHAATTGRLVVVATQLPPRFSLVRGRTLNRSLGT